eukprot:scaffold2632_cov158-Amphora_coffeaeformis.AAC.7
MSGDEDKKLTAQEAAIIEMLKQQNLEGGGDDDESGKKKHAFWDTQVGVNMAVHSLVHSFVLYGILGSRVNLGSVVLVF